MKYVLFITLFVCSSLMARTFIGQPGGPKFGSDGTVLLPGAGGTYFGSDGTTYLPGSGGTLFGSDGTVVLSGGGSTGFGSDGSVWHGMGSSPSTTPTRTVGSTGYSEPYQPSRRSVHSQPSRSFPERRPAYSTRPIVRTERSYPGRFIPIEPIAEDGYPSPRGACYCGYHKGHCMAFQKGSSKAMRSFASNRCSIEDCQENFNDLFHGVCREMWHYYTGRLRD